MKQENTPQNKQDLVKLAMLSAQRFAWEQGVAAQAIYEIGDTTTMVAMAHDAIMRQSADGRLAVVGDNIAVTDPAAAGEAVLRAYEVTGDPFYLEAAKKMLHYLMEEAPRTDRGVLCHNQITFWPEYSPDQIWADAAYMAPPFLAVMGELDEAVKQLLGFADYLQDAETGLMNHIYDAGQNRFVRQKLWATGNGWTLMGLGRVIDEAIRAGRSDVQQDLCGRAETLLQAMLRYQMPDGRFHDILDDPESFTDGASAMMMAAFVYRGIAHGWLPAEYLARADLVTATMEQYVDDYGIIHEVCGCPDFIIQGTSVESMAAYLMMHAWKKCVKRDSPQ